MEIDCESEPDRHRSADGDNLLVSNHRHRSYKETIMISKDSRRYLLFQRDKKRNLSSNRLE